MGKYYTDENICSQLAESAKKSVGSKRDHLLRELCKFKTKAADEFWSGGFSKWDKINLLPYLMICRSERISDWEAKRLDEYLEEYIANEPQEPHYKDYSHAELAGQAYFLLNTCLFKESDRMILVYKKIGKLCRRIRALDISWSSGELAAYGLPRFLVERCRLEEEQSGCESDFMSYLNDILIITAANAIMTDGEDETFTEKVRELAEGFPEAYAPAGFFVSFVKDTGMAYDKFYDHTLDPLKYPVILWTLMGLRYDKTLREYKIHSPVMFTGAENKKTYFLVPVRDLDLRWIGFLTGKILSDAENVSVRSPYYTRAFCRKFSGLLFDIAEAEDDRIRNACLSYFEKAAVIAGNPADFAGLAEYGNIRSYSELEELTVSIAKRVCEGRQICCYHSMIPFFMDKAFSRSDILSALTAAEEYLKQHGGSGRPTVNRFYEDLELMRQGRPNMLERRKSAAVAQ